MYVIVSARHLFNEDLFNDLYEFSYSMIHPILSLRTEVEQSIQEYINILNKHGILSRNNKYFDLEELEIKNFENNEDANKSAKVKKNVEKVIDKEINTPMTDKEFEENIKKQDEKIKKSKEKEDKSTQKKQKLGKCPLDKELNPATNRCVKRCKEGEQRNEKFRCVKIKQTKQKEQQPSIRKTAKNKQKSAKQCPPDKELNPTTNRCINRCKEGHHRNEKFKCVKNK
jgi:hypothetical protein